MSLKLKLRLRGETWDKESSCGKTVSFPTLADLAGSQEVVGGEVRKSWTWTRRFQLEMMSVSACSSSSVTNHAVKEEKSEMIWAPAAADGFTLAGSRQKESLMVCLTNKQWTPPLQHRSAAALCLLHNAGWKWIPRLRWDFEGSVEEPWVVPCLKHKTAPRSHLHASPFTDDVKLFFFCLPRSLTAEKDKRISLITNEKSPAYKCFVLFTHFPF